MSAKVVGANESLEQLPNSASASSSSPPDKNVISAEESTTESSPRNSPAEEESPPPTEESTSPTEESPSPTEESPSPTEELPSPTEKESSVKTNKLNKVNASAPGIEVPPPVTNKGTPLKKGSTGLTSSQITEKVNQLKTEMAAKGINPGNAILRQGFFHYMRLKQDGIEESDAIAQRDTLIQEKMAEAQQPKKSKCPPLPADLDIGGLKATMRNDFEQFMDGVERKVSSWLTRKMRGVSNMAVPTKVKKAPRGQNSRNSVYNALTRKRSNEQQYYKRPPKEILNGVRSYRNTHPEQSTKEAVKAYMLAKELSNKATAKKKRREKRLLVKTANKRNGEMSTQNVPRPNREENE
jgi:hypothetical protein